MRFAGAGMALLLLAGLPSPARADSRSLNWAGYAAATDFNAPEPTFEGVAATWAIPRVGGNSSARSSAWIGVGGYFTSGSPPDVRMLQVGSEHDVNCIPFTRNCRAEYFLWILSLPKTTEYLPTVPIRIEPGDRITASLERVDEYRWRVSVVRNAGSPGAESYSAFVHTQPGRLSAEWIVERPQFGGLSELASFGRIAFWEASAKVGGEWRGLSALNAERVVMIDWRGRAIATPSALSGDSFSVCPGAGCDRSPGWARAGDISRTPCGPR